jgi:hypothetical protein
MMEQVQKNSNIKKKLHFSVQEKCEKLHSLFKNYCFNIHHHHHHHKHLRKLFKMLHNDELCALCRSHIIVRVLTSRRLCWAGHGAWMKVIK